MQSMSLWEQWRVEERRKDDFNQAPAYMYAPWKPPFSMLCRDIGGVVLRNAGT